MKNKKIVLFTTVLLAVGFVVGIFFYQKSVDQKRALLSSGSDAPFVRAYSPSFGENKNNVTIVEFMDPECESCRAFHPIIKKVFSEYEKETKLVYRYLANHRNSAYAIKILEASKKQGKYKEVLDVLFAYQERWSANFSPEIVYGVLKNTSLDIEKLKTDIKEIDLSEMLSTDRADAKLLMVTGTPTIFVNGKILKNLSYKGLLDLVEAEIYK